MNIHPTAIVHPEALIGPGTSIGAFAFVGAFAIIGHNCTIGRYCEIREGCLIGDRVAMGSRCTLSAYTVVEERAIIKYGFVAADTADLEQPFEKDAPTIRAHVKIGANVTVMPGVIIGEGATIGACSQVRHDIPNDETWYGNPARRAK